MTILDASGDGRDPGIRAAVAALRGGRLAVLPTDTVYGVAADAFDTAGTTALFRVKHRSRQFPLPVLVRSPKQVIGLVTTVPPEAERLMAAYWPGPLTLVVRADPNLTWDLGQSDGTVALRMPHDDVTLQVIREVGPIAVTSANRSGQPAARTAREAEEELGDGVEVYLDDGPRTDTEPSTIVDLTRAEPHVLRAGTLDQEQVFAVARGELQPFEVDLAQDPGAAAPDDGLDGTTSG